MRLVLAVALLTACVDEPQDPLIGPGEAEDGKGDNANQPCGPIGPYAELYTTELAALWQTQPTYLCGYAAPVGETACGPIVANNAFYCTRDGGILWHHDFLRAQYVNHGQFAPAVILAHEWGHMNQHANGLWGDVSGRTRKQNEQHADCQAGIFIAAHQAAWGAFDVGPIYEGFSSLCAAASPDWRWWDPRSHGTCLERAAAFSYGYQQGLAYLTSLALAPQPTMLAICSLY
jgi:hypothetical protein